MRTFYDERMRFEDAERRVAFLHEGIARNEAILAEERAAGRGSSAEATQAWVYIDGIKEVLPEAEANVKKARARMNRAMKAGR